MLFIPVSTVHINSINEYIHGHVGPYEHSIAARGGQREQLAPGAAHSLILRQYPPLLFEIINCAPSEVPCIRVYNKQVSIKK